MHLRTASQALTVVKEMEEASAVFYERLAGTFPEHEEPFGAFAAENRKFSTQVERAYYGVISDAIEGGFAFDLETDEFALETEPAGDLPAALEQARTNEDTIIRFYTEAADQSRSLMADLPRAFEHVVKRRRRKRLPKLQELTG